MPALVCNTSPVLYLRRINHAHLVSTLFAPVYVPEPVMVELDAARPLVDAVRDQGFRMTQELYAEALRLAGEEASAQPSR